MFTIWKILPFPVRIVVLFVLTPFGKVCCEVLCKFGREAGFSLWPILKLKLLPDYCCPDEYGCSGTYCLVGIEL